MRNYVLLVHGIWTKGSWQEEVAWHYAPHFECIVIKYPYYRWLGPLNLILEPYVLLIMAVPLAAMHTWPVFNDIRIGLVSFLLFAAYLATYVRRTCAFNKILNMAGPYAQLQNQSHTHLIAHSLGTYLTGRALRTRSDFYLGRIVLVGCVLPRRFPWSTFGPGGNNTSKYLAVRNERARRDIVVWIAWCMSWLIRGLGIAGYRGFRRSQDLVHDVSNPWQVCPACIDRTALIHNVESSLGHSGTFVSSGYAEAFWLPFLWGIEPSEYVKFVNLCKLAAALDREWTPASQRAGHVDPRLVVIEAQLRNASWQWTGGEFGNFVKREVESRFPSSRLSSEQFVALAIRGTWQLVTNAMEARLARLDRRRRNAKEDPAADVAIAWLNPEQAVRRAVALLPQD